jgi:pimeloyl-ACP methyl ester carboxylesterase/DNA-binding CsgD family transcriptional regulator
MSDTIKWKPRELEILLLLADGLTNAEIGARLFLAHDTVRWYNKQIFIKLDARNRTQAVKRAAELGLIGNNSFSKTKIHPKRSSVHYVDNGSVHIAYQVIGDGPIDLLFIHGFISHLDAAWENYEFADFFDQLGKVARVILFDKRGVGLSDRIQGAPTLENTVEDATHVLDATASKRTFVMGTSEGAAAAVLLASTYPERVAGLILYGATPKIIRNGNQPIWAVHEEEFNEMIDQMQKSWGEPWAVETFAPSRAKDETFRTWWAKVLKSASSPSSIKDIFNLIRQVDIRQLLPQIPIRTLVIHKTGDRMVSIDAGKYFADNMPNTQWVELTGADHIYFVESEGILSAVSKFIKEMPNVSPTETCISTVLHMNQPIDTLQQQNINAEFNTFRARYVSIDKRDIIATFESPSRAIECATQFQKMFASEKLRISLHVGECYLENGKPTPFTQNISHKATKMTGESEILITQTLHDILAGSRFNLRQSSEREGAIMSDEMVLYTLV